jgi:hypothetical protein
MKNYQLLSLLLILTTLQTFSQNRVYENFFSINGNLLYPINNPNQGVYPILFYDKETDPKLLIGGFGIGISTISQAKNSNVGIKGQLNLSRHAYWDEPVFMRDAANSPLAPYQSGTIDYSVGLTGTIQYEFISNFFGGVGLGSQVLLTSLSRVPENPNSSGNPEKPYTTNGYYKILMPVIPIDLTFQRDNYLFNIRYEQALLNRYKKPLSDYKNGSYGILTFEIGFKIN